MEYAVRDCQGEILLKILQLIQKPQLRGAEIFASQLSNHLVSAGHEVKLIALLDGSASLPFSGSCRSLKRPLSKRFFDVEGWRMLADEIAAFKPDIIQANAGDTLKFAVFSKLRHSWKTPIIFRNANKVSDFVRQWPKRIFNGLLVSRLEHVISVSELCRQDFIGTYHFPAGNTTTIPIGIETQPEDTSIPVDLKDIFARSKVLVHVGSFVREKNHGGLLRIFHALSGKIENARLVLVGEGGLRSAIERQILEMGLMNKVFLLGQRYDALSIISNANALLLPSIIEGLPGVILEAMYCRTPVVAYDVGGISEVVRNGETGWLIKAGDEAGFCSAVESVLNGNVDSVKEYAFRMVTTEFDNKIISKRFLEVYQRVAS